MRDLLIIPILIALAFAAPMIVKLLPAPAFGQGATHGSGHHSHGHAQHHDWYQRLKQPGTNASCCDNRDCRPTRAYRDDDGVWRALLDGAWARVPADRVLNVVAPDGGSHICANEAGTILCFVAGVPKS